MAAIAAYHAPLGGQSVGRDPLVTRFLRGVMRLRPQVRSRVPPWDLAVVLDALCRPPFEPIEEISYRLLTLKPVFLLAISSLKRVGDLQALSVAPSYLDFAPGLAKVFQHAVIITYAQYIAISTATHVILLLYIYIYIYIYIYTHICIYTDVSKTLRCLHQKKFTKVILCP